MDNERIYKFSSGIVIRTFNGDYISLDELKAIEKTGDKLISVKYHGQTVMAE